MGPTLKNTAVRLSDETIRKLEFVESYINSSNPGLDAKKSDAMRVALEYGLIFFGLRYGINCDENFPELNDGSVDKRFGRIREIYGGYGETERRAVLRYLDHLEGFMK